MQNLKWDDLDELAVNDACTIADVNRALRRIFDIVDPNNEADLGGEAAHFFSGQDFAMWWHMTASIAQRRRKLDEFLNYLFAVSIEEWHDEYMVRTAVVG